MKRKIVAVTGARSEYDLLYTVYSSLNEHPDFDLGLIVTGPHLAEKYGYTAQFIERDGFKIEDRIYNLLDSDAKLARVASIGHQIPQLVQSFARIRPDLILVAGDREEAISVTLTAAYMDIPVAHFFGGDVAKDGNIDNSVRYASGKFAHIHFVTLEEHRQTLIKMGEDPWRIHVIGNPALDRFLSTPEWSKEEVISKMGFGNAAEPYFVLIQHSIITEVAEQAEHIRITLDAILSSGIKCFINYPNSDAGNAAIIEAYQEYSRNHPQQFHLFQNLDRVTYVNLLRHANCLLGNSSSGLLEAPSLGLPAINIGSRQRGRAHGKNVIFVGNVKTEIEKAIDTALHDTGFIAEVKKKINPYGDGRSTEKVIQVLSDVTIDKELIYKNITY